MSMSIELVSRKNMELRIMVEQDFNLEKAVCNHGFFMLLPNQWIASSKTFRRPLRLADGCSSVMASISTQSELNHSHLLVQLENLNTDTSLSDSDYDVIRKQVVRMLRLTKKDANDVRQFQEKHAEAKSKGCGRLFRSPDLFEDIIKTTLLCNATWSRTLQMSKYLCELQAELQSGMHRESYESPVKVRLRRKIPDYFRNSKRPKHEIANITTADSSTLKVVTCKSQGNFPNSKELAGLREDFLSMRCHLGKRAACIIRVANMVEKGRLKLSEFEETTTQVFDETFYEKFRKKLMNVKGIGAFSTSNILMCMGDYRNIPIDTETIQHLREEHGVEKGMKAATIEKNVKQVYDSFAPYQCLAYWYEHVESYERKLGLKLSSLSPSSYSQVAGSYFSSCNKRENKEEVECVKTAGKRKRTAVAAKTANSS